MNIKRLKGDRDTKTFVHLETEYIYNTRTKELYRALDGDEIFDLWIGQMNKKLKRNLNKQMFLELQLPLFV